MTCQKPKAFEIVLEGGAGELSKSALNFCFYRNESWHNLLPCAGDAFAETECELGLENRIPLAPTVRSSRRPVGEGNILGGEYAPFTVTKFHEPFSLKARHHGVNETPLTSFCSNGIADGNKKFVFVCDIELMERTQKLISVLVWL